MICSSIRESPVRALPIGNRYVERIQAVLRDHGLPGSDARGAAEGSIWTNLAAPAETPNQKARQAALARAIAGILTNPSERDAYATFLGRALDLPDEEAAALLWEDPRPLLLEVLPEAIWSDLGDESGPRHRALRTARFHDEANAGPHLSIVDNPFARAWLAHLLLAALSNEAIAKNVSLEAAAENLANGRADLTLEQTLDILFQSAVVDDADGHANQQDKLRQDLAHLLPTRR